MFSMKYVQYEICSVKDKIMNSEWLENVLIELDWSNKDMMRNIGVKERSIYYWLKNIRPVPLYILNIGICLLCNESILWDIFSSSPYTIVTTPASFARIT